MAINMIGDRGVRLAPGRDVAYLLPQVAADVAGNLLEHKHFAPLHRMLRHHCISEEDLLAAMAAWIEFMRLAQFEPEVPMQAALDRSGWTKSKPMAQVAVMYYVGANLTGDFFVGVKQAFDPNTETSTMSGMNAAGRELSRYLNMTWFQRWKYRRARRARSYY